MATYYIDLSGIDTPGRNGSTGQEWRTLSYACTRVAASAGHIIHVNAGTFNETAQSVVPLGVSIEGDGVTSVIRSTTLTTEWVPIISLNSGSPTNGNQEIRYLKLDGASRAAAMGINIVARHNVKIHHCTIVDFNWVGVGWKALDVGEETPPTVYLTGSEFHDNIVTNCAGADSWMRGALLAGGHEGMLIYGNTMLETGRTIGTQGWPIKFWYWGGWMKGCKIYGNNIQKTDASVFDFAIECNHSSGMEIYNNTIVGSIDLNHSTKGVYAYGAWIHDNTIGPTATGSYNFTAVTLEFDQDEVIIERNRIKNCGAPFLFTPRTNLVQNVKIRYNILENIENVNGFWGGLRFVGGSGFSISNFLVYNNVFYGNPDGNAYWCVMIDSEGDNLYTCSNLQVINNIFLNFSQSYLHLSRASSVTGFNLENNIIYQCGNSNLPTFSNGTPSSYTNANNQPGVNPLLTSATDFRLQAGSTGRDAGKNVGLTTDYLGYVVPFNSIPDIGSYEYGSALPPTRDPVSFSLSSYTPPIITKDTKSLSAYSPPANNAVNFAIGVYSPTDFVGIITNFGESPVLEGAVNESTAIAEVQSATQIKPVLIAESGTANEIQSATGIFSASVAEPGAAVDTQTGLRITASSISETGAASDTQLSSFVFMGSVVESGAAVELITGSFLTTGTISETSSAQDTQSALTVKAAQTNEAGSAADVVSATGNYHGYIYEAVTAQDIHASSTVYNVITNEVGGAADLILGSRIIPALVSETANVEDICGIFIIFETVNGDVYLTYSIDSGVLLSVSLSKLVAVTENISSPVMMKDYFNSDVMIIYELEDTVNID